MNKGNYNFFVDQNLTDKMRDIRESKIIQAFSKTTSTVNSLTQQKQESTIGKMYRNKKNQIQKRSIHNDVFGKPSGGGTTKGGISSASNDNNFNLSGTGFRNSSYRNENKYSKKASSKTYEKTVTTKVTQPSTSGPEETMNSTNQNPIGRIPSGKSIESNKFSSKHFKSLTPGKSEHDERSLSKGSKVSENLKMGRHPKIASSWAKMMFEESVSSAVDKKGNSNMQTPKKFLGISNHHNTSSAGYLNNSKSMKMSSNNLNPKS